MEYTTLSNTNLKISKLCLGTMTFGQQNTIEEAHQQLNYARERGINFFDTAEMYPVPICAETYSKTETYIGEWLKHQKREEIVLGSKIAGPGRNVDWIRGGESRINAKQIDDALHASLKRLQTDYLDLYQIHWPERYVPCFGESFYEPEKERPVTANFKEQLEALSKHIESGKIKYIGLSNETPYGVAEFIKLADEFNLPRVVTIQNAYSLLNRSFEFGLSEMCRNYKIGLLPYSILAFGHLTGKHLNGKKPANSRVNLFQGYAQRYAKINVEPATKAYVALAKKYNLSPVELALNFVKSKWFVNSVILGATSVEQLKEQIDASEKTLPDEIFAEINVIAQQFTNPAP